MRILYCLCLVINFVVFIWGPFIYSFMGSGKGKRLMYFLDSNIIDSKDWERPWDCLFFPCMFLTLCGGKSKWVKMDDLIVPPSITHSWV